MILDGKAIANDIYEELAPKYERLGRQVRLGIVVVGEDPVIASFVRIKERAGARLGVEFVKMELPESATTEEVLAAIKLSIDTCDAVIPQLPMPKHIDFERVLAAIPPEKDVDALNHTTTIDKRIVYEPVALAVLELLERGGVDVRGKHAIVVGSGRLVGAPVARMLKERGANVETVTRRHGSLEYIKMADIIVSGTGVSGIIKPDMIKEGVALIDAGTSELGKKVVGDVDPSCAPKCAVFTPVPGGVGPVAVAMIYRNLFALVNQ
jgi:methylenetetrahydrofolate dehydrogenase (NADP+)/methenyltetrahydrofolate cyclohydrolase